MTLMSDITETTPVAKSDEEREQILKDYVRGEVANQDAKISSQDKISAVLEYGKPVNHLLTCG
jgi:hypothetical protein